MADAPSVLNYIDTAFGVATFLISERLPATIENIRAFFVGRRQEVPAGFRLEDVQQLIALLIIDPDLLSDLMDSVRRAADEYRTCLRNVQRPQERAACDRRAERDICDTLNRVRDRNGGDIPTDYLNDQWNSYGCIRV